MLIDEGKGMLMNVMFEKMLIFMILQLCACVYIVLVGYGKKIMTKSFVICKSVDHIYHVFLFVQALHDNASYVSYFVINTCKYTMQSFIEIKLFKTLISAKLQTQQIFVFSDQTNDRFDLLSMSLVTL